MIDSYRMKMDMFAESFRKIVEELRKQEKRTYEERGSSEAMRRISKKYKHIHSHREHILNSVYTYSSVGALVK